MPHVFDGRWNSFVIDGATPGSDAPFQLEVDPDTKKLKPNSTHGGQRVTGDVTSLHISITHVFNPRLTTTYVGELAGEVVIGEVRHLVIIGVFTVIRADASARDMEGLEGFDAIRRIVETSTLAQEQEIWVATKPS
jgi:hypothetical protein